MMTTEPEDFGRVPQAAPGAIAASGDGAQSTLVSAHPGNAPSRGRWSLDYTDHVFVRDPPPSADAFCPECGEPWEYCACELPEYAGAWVAKLYPEKEDTQ
jgi:hypothetical protein